MRREAGAAPLLPLLLCVFFCKFVDVDDERLMGTRIADTGGIKAGWWAAAAAVGVSKEDLDAIRAAVAGDNMSAWIALDDMEVVSVDERSMVEEMRFDMGRFAESHKASS
jgi:hypothetical protein